MRPLESRRYNTTETLNTCSTHADQDEAGAGETHESWGASSDLRCPIACMRREQIYSDEILVLHWRVVILFQPEHNWDRRPIPFMHNATIDPAAEPYKSDMKGPRRQHSGITNHAYFSYCAR